MAIDPEEFKKRRAEKEQQRQKQQRSVIVRLLIAGVILSVCAVIILAVVGANRQNDPKTPDETQITENSNETTAPTAPSKTVIRLAAAGDLNVSEGIVAAGGTEYDYTGMLIDVAHLLADADITMLNFEGNFYGAPYGTDRSAPQPLANSLSRAGVDLVQLANSYSIYKGMEGLSKTIDTFRAAGVEPVGAYATKKEASAKKGYTIQNVQGIKIAFVAFTKGMDGMALPDGNEGCVNLLYKDYSTDYQQVDTEGITRVLQAAEKEKPDLTVALLHWGSEYNNNISASQEKIRELMQENGVDAIIGTHSHYVQKMVFDRDAGTFVAYSLGDFLSDSGRAGSEYSVILELEITKDLESGDTAVTGYSYTPIFTVAEADKPVRVVRIKEAMQAFEQGYLDRVSQETYDAMVYALTRIEARVAGE